MAMRRPEWPVLDDDPRAVPVVGHPVRLERQRDVGDDGRAEPPIEVGRVQPVDDVGDADRPAALETSEQIDDPERR